MTRRRQRAGRDAVGAVPGGPAPPACWCRSSLGRPHTERGETSLVDHFEAFVVPDRAADVESADGPRITLRKGRLMVPSRSTSAANAVPSVSRARGAVPAPTRVGDDAGIEQAPDEEQFGGPGLEEDPDIGDNAGGDEMVGGIVEVVVAAEEVRDAATQQVGGQQCRPCRLLMVEASRSVRGRGWRVHGEVACWRVHSQKRRSSLRSRSAFQVRHPKDRCRQRSQAACGRCVEVCEHIGSLSQ